MTNHQQGSADASLGGTISDMNSMLWIIATLAESGTLALGFKEKCTKDPVNPKINKNSQRDRGTVDLIPASADLVAE